MTERIRIVNTPPGQAPEWVRKEWVGLELPVEEDSPGSEKSTQIGARGGKPENLGGYPIRTSDAINSLREKSQQAAEWWETNLPLEVVPTFVFKKEACEIIPDTPDDKPTA